MSSQMWEKAIELGKQLAKMHESHMFDFMELSQLLVRGGVQIIQLYKQSAITPETTGNAASETDMSLNEQFVLLRPR